MIYNPETGISYERMNDRMLKIHLGGGRVLHLFTGEAPFHEHAHDHAQWGFTSTVVYGGYIEERFRPDGSFEHIERKQGDTFRVEATSIHRLVRLTTPETLTMVIPDLHTGNMSGDWCWREDGAYRRVHGTEDWIRHG